MTRPLVLATLATLLLAGCGDDSYEPEWDDGVLADGKADGLLDSAQPLVFDETGTGTVGGQQMDVYRLDLRGGDKIRATMRVTSGDLSPHFTLYYGASNHVSSATFSRTSTRIVKTYELEGGGRYYLAVRAYQNRGAGRYSINFECTGGPCAGEPVVTDLTIGERAECIGNARVCSFAALPAYDGNVGPARARTIFESCLNESMTSSGGACADACSDQDANDLCSDVIAALPYYADASPACMRVLTGCLVTCGDGDHGEPDEFWMTAESVCWSTGFNGTCDGYARGHRACPGGSYAEGSNAQCHALCEATAGAWTDDLDLMCVEACD